MVSAKVLVRLTSVLAGTPVPTPSRPPPAACSSAMLAAPRRSQLLALADADACHADSLGVAVCLRRSGSERTLARGGGPRRAAPRAGPDVTHKVMASWLDRRVGSGARSLRGLAGQGSQYMLYSSVQVIGRAADGSRSAASSLLATGVGRAARVHPLALATTDSAVPRAKASRSMASAQTTGPGPGSQWRTQAGVPSQARTSRGTASWCVPSRSPRPGGLPDPGACSAGAADAVIGRCPPGCRTARRLKRGLVRSPAGASPCDRLRLPFLRRDQANGPWYREHAVRTRAGPVLRLQPLRS